MKQIVAFRRLLKHCSSRQREQGGEVLNSALGVISQCVLHL